MSQHGLLCAVKLVMKNKSSGKAALENCQPQAKGILTLAQLEEVCYGTVQLNMREHKRWCATWT